MNFKIGQKVKIILNNKNPLYSEHMLKKYSNTIGTIVAVNDDKDHCVKVFNGYEYYINEKDLYEVEEKEPIKSRGFLVVDEKHKKFNNCTILPIRGDKRSAGYDFYSNEDVIIEPGQSHLFWTDVKSYMLEDEVLQIYVRSSIGLKKNLRLKNTVGIIDSSYFENESNDGNIGICLHNFGNDKVIIEKGERIAQGIFMKYLTIDEDNFINEFRTGGFGHTGTK